ncbi:disintegrin and metalloproteinase domain-containing protein 8 isoform X2 [Phascolarctos cinereus]
MCSSRLCCCLFVLILVLVMSLPSSLGLPGLSAHLPPSGPLTHVEQYEVVYPLKVPIPRARRDLSSPPSLYPENLRYVLGMKGSNFTLHLRRNRDLMGASYTETYTLANGTEVTEQPGDLQDHCFYQGHVEGHQDSAASISACHGIRGFFQTGSTVHLIEPLQGAGHEGRHAVYRAEHLIQKLVTCGVSNTTLEEDLEPRMAAAQKPRNWKSGTAPKKTHYVELFVVVDYMEYMKFRSREDIRSRVKEIVNHVDKLYQQLNFRVVLIGLEIWDQGDKAQISSNPDSTLDSFLQWRIQKLVPRKKHDNAQLITGVDFEKTTVGLAKVASMCTSGSGAVNQDHHANPIGVASTIAHEMGHNLGMDHDENIAGCYCHEQKQNGGCIMAASISTVFPKTFSTCSRSNLENFVGNDIFQTSCLTNFPKLDEIYGGPMCGNRFVERGEECDCGVPEECTNHCCNATTCRLVTGAMCAHGECCHECQVVPLGQICREAQDVCDLPEYCDGQRGECPENVFQENGTPCQDGYCYNGACPTHQQQCQALWGEGELGSVGRHPTGLPPCGPWDICLIWVCEGGGELPRRQETGAQEKGSWGPGKSPWPRIPQRVSPGDGDIPKHEILKRERNQGHGLQGSMWTPLTALGLRGQKRGAMGGCRCQAVIADPVWSGLPRRRGQGMVEQRLMLIGHGRSTWGRHQPRSEMSSPLIHTKKWYKTLGPLPIVWVQHSPPRPFPSWVGLGLVHFLPTGASVASDSCFRLDIQAGCSGSSRQSLNKCGVLHCSGGKVTNRAYCTITLGWIPCTIAGNGKDEPFEMVATGTKCGEQMVCYNGRCQDLHVYGAENCSSQCNGHGVCNHKRECHCQPGWAPPYCQQKVAAITSGAHGMLVGVLVTLAVLVLLIGVTFILYKRRMLPPLQKRKIATETPSGLSNPLFHEGGCRAPGLVSTASAAQHPKSRSALVVPGQPPPAPPAAAGPQAPFRVPVYTRQAPQQSKPAPPSKPLPELKPKQVRQLWGQGEHSPELSCPSWTPHIQGQLHPPLSVPKLSPQSQAFYLLRSRGATLPILTDPCHPVSFMSSF